MDGQTEMMDGQTDGWMDRCTSAYVGGGHTSSYGGGVNMSS